jgi:hypothetical protein
MKNDGVLVEILTKKIYLEIILNWKYLERGALQGFQIFRFGREFGNLESNWKVFGNSKSFQIDFGQTPTVFAFL